MGRKRPLDELDPRHALAAGRGHASLRWAERKERENAAWDSRWPVDRELWIAATLQRQAAEAELRSAQECVVQQLLSTAVPQLCSCRQSDNRLLGDDCVMVATGEVEHAAYFGQGSVVCEVTVPVYRCTAHGVGGVTVHPFQVGCVPTSPVINTVYLSEGLVRHARWLQLKSGLSVHGKAAGHLSINYSCCCYLLSFLCVVRTPLLLNDCRIHRFCERDGHLAGPGPQHQRNRRALDPQAGDVAEGGAQHELVGRAL